MSKPALIVIDPQNDYFEGGQFPLWNTEATMAAVERAVSAAQVRAIPVVLVQHVADVTNGPAPFFNPDSEGVRLHSRMISIAPSAPVVVKQYADAFERTALHDTLQRLGADELILCGMMTHNCVTHTALSRRADEYRKVTVLTDASTTVSEILHLIALNALSTRVALETVDQAFAPAS